MNGNIRQRRGGCWEQTVDLGRDLHGRRRGMYLTVRGAKTRARRRLLDRAAKLLGDHSP